MINILDIQPNIVSKDIKGYSFLVYGMAKVGKTTFAASFPKSLILGFEIGYKAIPGVRAVPINSWAEFLQVLGQLKAEKNKAEIAKKKGEVYELHYETIIIDIVDIAWSLCEKYILSQQGVDKVSDIPYGGGYTMIANEFDSKMRSLIQMGYGVIFITHDKSTAMEDNPKIKTTTCSLPSRPKNIITRMVDVYGYLTVEKDSDGALIRKIHVRATPEWDAGTRFKYLKESIDLSYNSVLKAIDDAIDKEMTEVGTDFSTTEYINYDPGHNARSFEDLTASIDETIGKLMDKNPDLYTRKITQVVEERLGKGKKLNKATEENLEQLEIIDSDLKAFLEE